MAAVGRTETVAWTREGETPGKRLLVPPNATLSRGQSAVVLFAFLSHDVHPLKVEIASVRRAFRNSTREPVAPFDRASQEPDVTVPDCLSGSSQNFCLTLQKGDPLPIRPVCNSLSRTT